MARQAIHTDRAPSNPRYSQAVLAGDLVFVAGTPGLDMSTQTWPDQIEGQAEHALKNLEAILVEAGCSLNDVVKVTVFLTDPAHSASTADIFLRAFASPPPARARGRVKVPTYGHRKSPSSTV